MITDVVEDLDHWIRGSVQADPVRILKRARDEIVALRQAGVVRYSHGAKVLYGVTASRIRAEALEEAARAVEQLQEHPQPWWRLACEEYEDAIRALKDKS
jgi:hypothetical protein